MSERSASEHHQVCHLIPWYVNGTLGEQDMDQVTAHLSGCSECAQEIELEGRIAKAMRSDPQNLDTLIGTQAQALQQLQHKLQRPARLRRAWHQSGPLAWVAWPALAAGLVAAVALGFLAGRSTSDLSYSLMTASERGNGPVIQVIFQPTAREQDIRLLLSDSGGELLGSPSAKGVYRIELPADVSIADYAPRLMQHPAVRWAEMELR